MPNAVTAEQPLESRANVIKTQRHFAFPIGLFLAFLTPACGGDIVLPGEGEAATLEIATGNEQLGPAGATLADPVVVRVLDTRDRPVPNQDVTFSIGSGGGSVAPATVKSDAAGRAAAAWTLGPSSGSQMLRVQTPRGGSGSLEVTLSATAVAGSGSILVEAGGDEQTGPVNSALADSLVVKATDALGNPVANVEVTWSVAGGGSIDPVTVVTGANGLAAAERVLGPAAGAQSAQATVPGFTGSPVTFTHTSVPANPTALVKISGDGQTAPGGFEAAEDLVVRLEDDNGNGIGGRSITWVVPAGSGSVDPVNTTTNANGLATTRWTLPSGVGSYGVSAVFSGLPAVPFTGTATADVPTTIELVSGNNQNAVVGGAVANPLVVRVTDANDNPVANVGVAWTAAGGGSVSDANTATNASGLAQVTRTLGLVPGAYATTAAVDGLSGSPITFTSTATVGPAAKLAIITQPGSPTTSGNAFSPAPVIQLQDAQGNDVNVGGIEVTASITSGQAGASLVNAERNTNGSGRAVFNNLRITAPPDDDYVLTFTAAAGGVPLSSVSSSPLTVGAGSATRIVITQQPSATASNGAVFAVQPVVQVVDATGNPVAGNRTIQVAVGDGAGTLEGTLSANTGAGSTATFTDLRITGLVGARTLIFSSGPLTPAESNQITITTGPAASIAIVDPGTTNNQSAPVNTAVANDPAVRVTDTGGNPVEGVAVGFAVTGGGGTVDPAAPATVTTGADGIATVNSWTLGPLAGPNSLDATASVGTVTFTATASAASTTTSLSAEPTSSLQGDQVTFTANVASTGGTPTGQVSFRDNGSEIGLETLASGVATFATTDLAAGTHLITAHYLGDGTTFGASASSPSSYIVAAANVAPSAQADAFSVDEDATLTIAADGVLDNDSDADGDDLTAQPVAGPQNAQGFSLGSNGSFIYTPAPDFNDNDSFTYQANDGQANSNVATVTITVNPVNDAPEFDAEGDVATSSLVSSVLGESHAGWASGISPGPPDESESGQSVSFEISTDTDDAFQTDLTPAIDADGNLSYRPFLRFDTIVVTATVLARDSDDATSDLQSFTITINP